MFGSREENSKPINSISIHLGFADFPQLKNLTLDSKGEILLSAILAREKVVDKDKVEKWMRINGVKVLKEKRMK